MRRFLYHPLSAILIFLPGVLVLLSLQDTPAADSKDKLPHLEPVKHKSYTETMPGGKVKFEMIAVPGGTYLMGSPKDEKGRKDDEGPQHPVTIRPLWVGKCEVTWDEYDQYWKSKPEGNDPKPGEKSKDVNAVTRPTPPYADETFGHGREGQPAICITHHAAMEYCYWLSRKTGKKYRLPTEAEWEWACRAGTTTAYSFGEDPAKLGEYAWFAGNSEEVTHKVAEKKPNPWGLYDMHGNVSEWCLDHYRKDYYSTFPLDRATVEPFLMPTDKRFPHVARGGAWSDQPVGCRSAARRGSDKTWIKLDPQRPQSIWWLTSAEFVGFRIVREVEELDALKTLRSKVTRESE